MLGGRSLKAVHVHVCGGRSYRYADHLQNERVQRGLGTGRGGGLLAHLNPTPEIQPQYIEQDRCLIPTTAKVMDQSGGGGLGCCVFIYVCVWLGLL